MAAQYRPYRDEDHCDGLENDNLNWTDNEPGSVQIYEKTTEALPFSTNRRFLLAAVGVTLISVILGFVVGYFAHSQHSECVANIAVALHSTRDEDVGVRRKIIDAVDSNRIRKVVEDFSKEPRIPGSTRDISLVKQIEQEFHANSFDKVEVKSYNVLLSVPDDENPNGVEIVDKDEHKVFFSSIPSMSNSKNKYASFCAYSPPAKVDGDTVFVNYGRAVDYLVLEKMNVSVKGKILIAKQFNLAADEQLLYAQQNDATALLLYPEPADYSSGKDSDGVPIPSDAIRSESVLKWSVTGDPLTPGYPSTHYAAKLPNLPLPKIPVQPISVQTAYEILGLMGGKEVPKDWTGLFNFTYRFGPGFQNTSLKLRLQINNKYVNRTIHNVIGYIKGLVEPDRYVIIGNHRDSWGNGAVDAAGGTAAFLELSKVFGDLVKSGWKPRRTIMFCNWGAEEYNLIGSTEWMEENYNIIYSRAVAYINIDIIVLGNGSLTVDASPLLHNVIYNATKEVLNPDGSGEYKTVYDKWLYSFPMMRNYSQLVIPMTYFKNHFMEAEIDDYHSDLFTESDGEELIDDVEGPSLFKSYLSSSTIQIRPKIRQLNTRGAYSLFSTFAGVPSVEMTYVPFSSHEEPNIYSYPFIHTQYDNIDWVKSIDPHFRYHKAVTQVIGEIVRDLSDSLFLPFNLLHYAQVLKDLFSSLQIRILSIMELKEIDTNALNSAIHNFTKAALNFHYNQEKADLRDPMIIRRFNDQLLMLERAFLDVNGLPRNSMKKHIITSPSEMVSPYDDTFPGLMDEFAILFHNDSKYSETNLEIIKTHFPVLVFAIQNAANVLNEL